MPETAPDIAAPETRDENALDLGYTVSVEAFSGPLDLLLFLVRKTELDIVDIPVAAIADQFVSLVSEWQREGTLDLEAAGDFILMAATLLEIKARTIAPPPLEEGERPAEDEDDILDPRTDLIGKLLAYRKFKEAVGLLVEREAERALHVTRQLREDIPEDPDEAAGIDLGELQVAELSKYWYTLLARIGGGGPRTVMKDDIPIEGSIRKLAERAEQERELSLHQLFAAEPALQGRISMLMATLECTRQRIVQATQHEQYADAQLRFRPVEERTIVPVVFPPEEGGKKRRRRPPLVTFQAPVAPSSDELEDAPEPEEKHETDEERFLRELNEACDLDGVLGRVHDVEKGFQQYWETLHPPEPKPVVEPPAALVAEPVVAPEARIESPGLPVEAQVPVVEPAPAAEAPAVAAGDIVAVETAPVPVVEQAAEATVPGEAVVAPVDAAAVVEPVASDAALVDAGAPPGGEPMPAAERAHAESAPIALADGSQALAVEPSAEPAVDAASAGEPVVSATEPVEPVAEIIPAEPAVASSTAEGMPVAADEPVPAPAEPTSAVELANEQEPLIEPAAGVTQEDTPVLAEAAPVEAEPELLPVAADEPVAAPVEPTSAVEPVVEQEPVVEPAAAVTQEDHPILTETAPVEAEPEPVVTTAVETAEETEPPVALVRDRIPEVRVEIVQEEPDAEMEAPAAATEEIPPDRSASTAARAVTLAVEPEHASAVVEDHIAQAEQQEQSSEAAVRPVEAPAAPISDPVAAIQVPSVVGVPPIAVVEAEPLLAEPQLAEPQLAEPQPAEPQAAAEAAVLAIAEEPVPAASAPCVEKPADLPVIEPVAAAAPAISAAPMGDPQPAPGAERRPGWSRTLLLLAAGSAGAALAGWWAFRAPPEPLTPVYPMAAATAVATPLPAATVPVEPAPLIVAAEPQPVASVPYVAPASAAQLDGLRRAPSIELLALAEGPTTQWLGRVELPIAVPWYACAPVADAPASLFAFVHPPVLTGLPLLAFAREGAWAWCAAGAWVPPRARVLPISAFVPVVEAPTDLAAWAMAPDLRGVPAEVFLQPTGWAICAGRPATAITLRPPVRLAEAAAVETAVPAIAEPAATAVPEAPASTVPGAPAPAEAGLPVPEPTDGIAPTADGIP